MEATETKRIEVKSSEQLLFEIRSVLAKANPVSNNSMTTTNKTGKPKLSKLQQKLQNIVGCKPDNSQKISQLPDWRQNNYSISFILNSSNCAKMFGFPCFKSCCDRSATTVSNDSKQTNYTEKPNYSFPQSRIEILDLPPAPKTPLSEWYLSNFAIVRNLDENQMTQGTCKTVADIHKSFRVSTSYNKKDAKNGSLFKQVHDFEKTARNFLADRDWTIVKEKICQSKLPKSHSFWKKVIEKEPQNVTQVQLKCDRLRLGGSTLPPSNPIDDSAAAAANNVIYLTKVADGKTFKPGPLSKKRILLADKKTDTKWDYKLQEIPALNIIVKPELGKQLSPVALKYIHLSKMKSSQIDENWAQFAVSTLTVNRKRLSSTAEFAFKIPFKNNESKVLVKKQKKEVFKFDYGKMSNDDDVAAVLENLLKFVEKKEFFDAHLQTLNRDPHDVNRNVEDVLISNELDPKKSSDSLNVIKRPRTTKQLCELRRLNVQIIEVATMDQIETKQNYSGHVQNRCSKQVCSYGCICNSLKFGYDYVTNENAHCRNIECMFSCECGYVPIDRLKLKNMMFLPSGTDIMSTETVRRLQIKAQEHLSKEQKKFSQTVIQSQNKTIIVDDLQEKRARKAAINCKMNFANGWIDDSTKGKESLADKKKLKISQKSTKEFKSDFQLKLKYPIEFDANKFMIYCMIHDFYNCPCNNNLKYEFREDFLLSSPKATRQNSANTNNPMKTKYRNSNGSSSSSTTTTTTSTSTSTSTSTTTTNKKSQNSSYKYTTKNKLNGEDEAVGRKSTDDRLPQRILRNRRHPSDDDENQSSESEDCENVHDEDGVDNESDDEDDYDEYDDDEKDDDYGHKRKKQKPLKYKKRKQQKRNSDVESDDSFEPPLPAKAPHLNVPLPSYSDSNSPTPPPPPLVRLSPPPTTTTTMRLPPLRIPKNRITLPFETSKQSLMPTATNTADSHHQQYHHHQHHHHHYHRSSASIIQTIFDSGDVTKFGLPSLHAQWKCIYLKTNFYCIMFKDFNVAISYEDLRFAVNSSAVCKQTVMIELKMFGKSGGKVTGVYAMPSIKNRVFLGPFALDDVIQLQIIGDKNQAPDIIEFVHINKDQITENREHFDDSTNNNNENSLKKRKLQVESQSGHPRKRPRMEDKNISHTNIDNKTDNGSEASLVLSNKNSKKDAKMPSTNRFPNTVNANGSSEHLNNNDVPIICKMSVNHTGGVDNVQAVVAATATNNFLNPLNSAILMKNTNIQTFSTTNGLDRSKINGWKWSKKWFVLRYPEIGYFSFYEFKKSNNTEYYFDNPTRKNERIHFKIVENIARYIYEILKRHIFFRPEKLKLNFRIISDPDGIKQMQPFDPSILNFTHILTESCLQKITSLTLDQLEQYQIGKVNGTYVSCMRKTLPKPNDTLVINIDGKQIPNLTDELVPENSNLNDQHPLDDAVCASNQNVSSNSKSENCQKFQNEKVSSEKCENQSQQQQKEKTRTK